MLHDLKRAAVLFTYTFTLLSFWQIRLIYTKELGFKGLGFKQLSSGSLATQTVLKGMLPSWGAQSLFGRNSTLLIILRTP